MEVLIMSELDRELNKLGVDRIAISPYKQWTRGYMQVLEIRLMMTF